MLAKRRQALLGIALLVVMTFAVFKLSKDFGGESGSLTALADTGYAVALPSGWRLEELTRDHPSFGGQSDPFLLRSTHGIKNREWWAVFKSDVRGGFDPACTIYYFVAPIDQAYLDDEPLANEADRRGVPHVGPGMNEEYAAKYNISPLAYFSREQFKGDSTKYYDFIAMKGGAENQGCLDIARSIQKMR